MNYLGPLPTLAERLATGRALRESTPRSTLATLAERPEGYDAVARLMWQGESRVADLLAIRYQRMLVSPLAFYRGAALLMAEDLARGPSSSLDLQICGDAHLSNFGVFSSPERQLVFDVNDFDETDEGPFEWDVKRLVTSTVIASHFLGHSAAQQERIAVAVAREYRQAMGRFAKETRLEVWYAQLDVGAVLKDLRGFLGEHESAKVATVIGQAKSQDTARSYEKMVTYVDGQPRIVIRPPLITPMDEEGETWAMRDALEEIVKGYAETLSSDRRTLLSQFVPVDAAHRVVGVGSVGLRCYVMLFVGRDKDDPFFLQIKEAQSSVVSISRGTTTNVGHGERVVHGQRQMQATPDAFLGWHTLNIGDVTRSFYVRQLYDNKATVLVERLDESLLVAYGRACSWALARAHARSGRSGEISGFLGKNTSFETSMASFALAYRDRNEADYQELQRAAKQGRITVAS